MSRSSGILVAIDGPAGSGKSTVAKAVSEKLHIGFLDTGAMYRALTLACLNEATDTGDVEAVLEVADRMDFRAEGTALNSRFFLGPTEVTADLRSTRVAENVSKVAGLIPVRRWMTKEQRAQMLEARANGAGMVAEGRDITTVVCPEADVRVLLIASPDARVRRRTLEMFGEVSPALLEKTRALVEGRDEVDSLVSEFLTPAPGVRVIDSSDMAIAQVVNEIVDSVKTFRETRQ